MCFTHLVPQIIVAIIATPPVQFSVSYIKKEKKNISVYIGLGPEWDL